MVEKSPIEQSLQRKLTAREKELLSWFRRLVADIHGECGDVGTVRLLLLVSAAETRLLAGLIEAGWQVPEEEVQTLVAIRKLCAEVARIGGAIP